MFNSLIHFEFIFAYGMRICLLYSFTCSSAVFPTPCIEKTGIFPLSILGFLSHRLIDHKCMGLFLGFLSCSTDTCVCTGTKPVAYCFITVAFKIQFRDSFTSKGLDVFSL